MKKEYMKDVSDADMVWLLDIVSRVDDYLKDHK